MKKTTSRRKKNSRNIQRVAGERGIVTQPLDRDIPEGAREEVLSQEEIETPKTENWSGPDDRGEDLVNIKDPLVQEPERDTQTPPELTQKRPGKTPKPNENLADHFDAERKSRPLF